MVTEIALSNSPNQTFSVTIPGGSRNLSLIIRLSYNTPAGYWVMGIYDSSDSPIVLNIPLLCGHDLLEQYQYLNIGSAYVVNVGDTTIENPDNTTISTNFKLLWELG